MRRTLGTLALLLTVAGCGSDTSADSPAPSGETESETETVTLVHATAGGGKVEAKATDVSDQADLAAYVARFDDSLGAQVTEGGRRGRRGPRARPSGRGRLRRTARRVVEDGVIVAEKVAKPMQECYAPVTTVAVAAG